MVETSTEQSWVETHWIWLRCNIDDDQDGVLYPDDCVDTDANIYPGQTERCNGLDDNCDDLVDGLGAEGSVVLYKDTDNDGFGAPSPIASGCEGTEGWSTLNTDCDDSDPTTYPNADEICDFIDNDCDVAIDEHPVDPARWYRDQDKDGLGDPTLITLACERPNGHVDNKLDCDDLSDKPCETPGACTSSGLAGLSAWLLILPAVRRRRQKRAECSKSHRPLRS